MYFFSPLELLEDNRPLNINSINWKHIAVLHYDVSDLNIDTFYFLVYTTITKCNTWSCLPIKNTHFSMDFINLWYFSGQAWDLV